MDCTKIKVEMAEGGLLEPLVITEDGDKPEGAIETLTAKSTVVIAQSCSTEMALKKEEEHSGEDRNEDRNIATETCLEDQNSQKQQSNAEDGQTGDDVVSKEDKQEDKSEEAENMSDGLDRGDGESEGQTHGVMRITEKPESDTEGEIVTQHDPEVDKTLLNPSEEEPEGTKSREDDPKKAHRLTPDFPEALYELLCTLQEGRRLNDQRCSFRLERVVPRRRCHSEPNTNKPANRVVFSSMTSLQKEEFFELVATAQARRLDDQRAQLERSPLPKPKARSFRGSLKQLSFVKRPAPAPAPVPAPVPVPKEDLYNMILTTQAQGRLEDQRSRAPGPMDDEDFFSLLLRVQGGRMDEQRTELPRMLQT